MAWAQGARAKLAAQGCHQQTDGEELAGLHTQHRGAHPALSASSVSSISHFFLGPGNSTCFATSANKCPLQTHSLQLHCKGQKQPLHRQLIPVLISWTRKKKTAKALSRSGKNTRRSFLDLFASALEQHLENPSLPSSESLKVAFTFLASPVLHFVGGISCICLQNIHEGLQLCKGINTQPLSPLQRALTSLITWNFS